VSNFARQNPGLLTAFPPAGVDKHEPGRLDEVVQLTHPFLGPLVRFRDIEVETQLAAAAQTVLSTAVPPGEVWYVQGAALQNPDAAQHLEWALVNVALGSAIPLWNTRMDGAGAAWPAVILYPLVRPILIGPGWQLRGFREVGGVGNFFLIFNRVRLSLAEVPPSL
jgi:hypothetical protein